MRLRQLILVILLLSAPAIVPAVAQAHGGEPAISAFPAQAAAGGELTVFGEDLEPDASMQLHLLTAEGNLLVAEPRTDAAGHFTAKVTLPDTLTERTYELRLTAPTGASTSTFVTVVRSDTGAADRNPSTPSNSSTGILTAAVLTLAGIGLLILALRRTTRQRRAEG